MATVPTRGNLAQNAYLAWLTQETEDRAAQVLTYRTYYDGNPPTTLTDRQAAFLNVEREKNFGVNICGVIVDTVVERLQVTGFDVTTPPMLPDEEPPPELPEGEQGPEEALGSVLDRWWQVNRMDAVQDHVHRAALREAESFIVVGYDEEKGAPTFDYDFAFDGSNGVRVHRKPGTYNQLAFASKRWVEGSTKTRQRLNLYFPDRIEKWVNEQKAGGAYSEVGWQPYEDADDPTLVRAMLKDPNGEPYEAAVSWWTDSGQQGGKPLGVPIIPFVNRDNGTGNGKSEIDDALPVQDAINKTVLDILASCDMTGFQMYWMAGTQPEGGYKVYPGALLTVQEDADGHAEMGVLPAGSVQGLLSALDSFIALASGITGTPQSRFTPAAVRPAEGTQRQEEAALVAKVKGLQKSFGNAWEDVLRMGLKVADAFGNLQVTDTDKLLLSASWADAEVRNEREHVEAIATKVEKLGIPQEQAWREVGYSADEIRDFKETKAEQRAEAIEEETVKNQGKNADALAMIGRAALQGAANNGGRARTAPGPEPALKPCIF